MDEPRPAGTPATRPDTPSRLGSALPWLILALLALGASLYAAWLYADRDRIADELAIARTELGQLRQVVAEAEGRLQELEAGLEDQQGEVRRRGAAIVECREALQRIAAAWEAVANAMTEVGQLDEEEARRFAREANEQRRAASRAARRCG